MCQFAQYTRQESNTSEKHARKPHFPGPRGTKSGTLGDEPLDELLRLWPELTIGQRTEVLSLARRLVQSRERRGAS